MRLLIISLGLLFLFALVNQSAHAQSPCVHVDFRLDTTYTLDQQAICDAAQPWQAEGIHLFIYLTDATTTSENAWFDLLDQIERENGIRDVSGFNNTTLALEASTAQTSWSYSITYGEALFDTPLDTGQTAVNQIKNSLRTHIQAENPTTAFIEAIEIAYTTNYPPPSLWSIGTIILVSFSIVMGIGALLYKPMIKPAITRRQRQRQLQTQQKTVQQNVANLLLALERLLAGENEQDTVLYQLFAAYGGAHYPDRNAQIQEWLRYSRAALDSAFNLRRELLPSELTEKQELALDEQVRHWESLYLTLVGTGKDIHSLTDEELQDLLDPLVILERQKPEGPLARQLDEIRHDIVGKPLKITPLIVKPGEANEKGILDYISLVESQIADLMEAQTMAPDQLAEARQRRLAVGKVITTHMPLGLTETEIFHAIDARLTQAEQDLQSGIYFDVLEGTDLATRDIAIAEDLSTAVAEHQERQIQLNSITEAGFRPANLAIDRQEIEEDIRQITIHLSQGHYLAVDDWIDELDADSIRTLNAAQAWQEQYHHNQESLQQSRQQLTVIKEKIPATLTAWQQLQTYSQGNWNDLQTPYQGQISLQAIQNQHLPEVERLNNMEVQDVMQAEEILVEAKATLLAVERALQTIHNRLTEVITAEAHIEAGIAQAKADLTKAITLRDKENSKIGSKVDKQIVQATQELEQAQQYMNGREFMAAVKCQTTAWHLATEAHASADKQVRAINQLLTELNALTTVIDTEVATAVNEAKHLPQQIPTGKTSDLILQTLNTLSQAKQIHAQTISLEDHALASALQETINGYRQAKQLAITMTTHISQDRQTYDNLRRDTEHQITMAQSTIAQAERLTRHRLSGNTGHQALRRAREALPTEQLTNSLTRTALQRIHQKANLAYEYASEAKRKANQAIQYRERAKRKVIANQTSSSWSSSSRSSSWSSSRTSNRSISRSSRSSSASSRSNSSRSSSSRASSSRSSSRSSSMGRSRRR